jgi:Protein of unknown function (DUF1552)
MSATRTPSTANRTETTVKMAKMTSSKPATNQDRFSRRALLKKMGVGAAMLPLIHAERAVGQDATKPFPKRLVLVTWTNGVIKSSFYPSGSELTIGATLKPLEPWAKKITIPMGLHLNLATYAGHFAWGALWTGKAKGRNGDGPSIDQHVSDQIAKTVKLPIPLLTTGVRCFGDGLPSSWRAAGQRNTPDDIPSRVFGRLFAGASMPTGQIDLARNRRKSVLDFVGRELEQFRKRLGTVDRAKVEAHHESLRDIERQLSAPSAAVGCAKPMVAGGTGKPDAPTGLKSMYDLIAAALRCDVTRVATVDIYDDGGGDGNSFPFLGINRDYHAVAHSGGGAAADKIKIDSWLFTQVANLVKQLDDTVEGDGTALDNSLIVTGNGMEDGASHRVGPIPFCMIGSAGGYFKTGRVIRFPDPTPHNKLLASIVTGMGYPVTGYGAAGKEGTLPELSS